MPTRCEAGVLGTVLHSGIPLKKQVPPPNKHATTNTRILLPSNDTPQKEIGQTYLPKGVYAANMILYVV